MSYSHKLRQSENECILKSSFFQKDTQKNYFINKSISNSGKKFESSKPLSSSLINQNKREIIIEWREGEKELYLVGSFKIFDKFFLSKNNKKMNIYSKFYSRNYNRKHQFKVNGKIRINDIYIIYNKPSLINNKEKEEISINNDNRNLSISTNNSSKTSITKNNINKSNINYKIEKINTKNIKNNFEFSKKNYCNYYPSQNEMKNNADKKPTHFPSECFHGVNQFHDNIGKKQYLILKESNYNSNNDSYKVIDKKDHILLNHLCQKTINNKIINSFTIKYRHKNSTFIYYK